ncbi:MAG TPA: hypothetical protein VFT29_17685, partial [Gemmatimonadaceae bacterium]|nr:hypothetical protein [Gemmatimonadaceae bacterium]
MRSSVLVTCVLGLALGASDARSQDTARSRPRAEQRIKVSKGEVTLAGAPRTDTVFLTRTDTVFLTRRDTVRVPRMVVRVDTVVRTPPPPPTVPRGALYFGLYGGPTAPSGNVDRLYGNGAHIGGALGWENE